MDNTLYKYGNGIDGAISGVATAGLCVATGGVACAALVGTQGYIAGKQEARKVLIQRKEKEQAEKEKAIIRALAKVEAEKRGADVDECAWFNPFC